MPILLNWRTQLQNTGAGASIRESILVFPALEGGPHYL